MIRAVSLTGCVQLPQGVSHEKKAGSRYGAPQRIARNPAVGRQKPGFPSGDEPLLAAALVGRNYNLRLPTLTQPSTWLAWSNYWVRKVSQRHFAKGATNRA